LPQREKGGYTGDGQIIAEASMHDFQMAAFYTNWLNDMQDVQEAMARYLIQLLSFLADTVAVLHLAAYTCASLVDVSLLQ